jgi:hypothetical protein
MHGVKGASPILRRVAENAAKIALISAVGRSPFQPHITLEDFSIGHAIARWSARSMIQNVALFIADNDIERDANDIERFVKSAPKNGRLYREVQSKFRRIRPRELQEAIGALIEQGAIRLEVSSGEAGGHPVKRLYPGE